MPTKIADEPRKPLQPCLTTRITTSTNSASSRFSIEPKSFAELPPPKELMPTEISDRPILSTTVPVTTAGKNLRSGLRKKPSTVSNRPPRMDAPIIAPYAITPPPMVAATLLNTPIKPELVPMMIGTLPPIGPMENSCTSVTTPATNIAFCRTLTCRSANSPPAMPHAPMMMSSGVRLPTNIAKTCCSPSGILRDKGIFASKSCAASIEIFSCIPTLLCVVL